MPRKKPETFEVLLSDEAQNDLYGILTIIGEKAGFQVAEQYVDRMIKTCESLSLFPLRGTARNDLGHGFRTMGFERRATIVFQVRATDVLIITVAYAGRDYETLLSKEE